MTDLNLPDRIADLLRNDPACVGRVTVGTINAIASECERTITAALATLSKPEPAAVGEVSISREVFDFLKGVGSLDGCHFGDKHPTERGAFWWRKHMTASPVPSGGADEKAIRHDERKKIIAQGCIHTRKAGENADYDRPDLSQWQHDQSEYFDPTILEIVSEYAVWRDGKEAVATCNDSLQVAPPSPSSEAISPPDAPTATELDACNEAMVCTGCGTTKTVAFIRANSATAFTCCPERKMIPVREMWRGAVTQENARAFDLLTKAVGDITAALIMAGKEDKLREWTAPYIEAINAHDAQAEIIAALPKARGIEPVGFMYSQPWPTDDPRPQFRDESWSIKEGRFAGWTETPLYASPYRALERFPDDVKNVQSRIVIVHQLRASADIQDYATKRDTGWADTSDRATLMRKAADTIEALAAPEKDA